MGKLFNIFNILKSFNLLIGFAIILLSRQEAAAFTSGRIIVSPVNIPTAQSTYGVYPNTINMIANDIINALNKKSLMDVPDINSTNDLIESYRLTKPYKDFLRNYQDNRVIDYKTCSLIGKKLGVDKILLVSGGFDVQNQFLGKKSSSMFSKVFPYFLPLTSFFGKDLFLFTLVTHTDLSLYNKLSSDDPIKSTYLLNIQLTLIDTATGASVWEKSYEKGIEAADFGTSSNSFGENGISSGKLKKFSGEVADDTSTALLNLPNEMEYKSVDSTIVKDNADTRRKGLSMDGKMTRDGQPSSANDKYLENIRKQNYKDWIKERAQ